MTTSPTTVLVVDDLEPARNMLRRLLLREGYDVVTAGDGPGAIDLLEGRPVDLVLLDMAMPGMTGLEVLRRIRVAHSPTDLPVIIQTAFTERQNMIEALEIGANDFVAKPIDFPVLLARIHAQLRIREPKSGDVSQESRDFDGIPTAELKPGTCIANRYEIQVQIGSGNFASIYRARHLALDQEVAIKVLRAEVADRPDALARFRTEATLARQLNHPNAITVLDFGVTAQGRPYLVMELLIGHSLDSLLAEEPRLSPARCAEVLLPVCHVLGDAHEMGIIHRDLKPSNIFLARVHRRQKVKVLDFGIAKLRTDLSAGASLTMEGSWVGTPAYMAPERLQSMPYDGRSDVYSVGVMLYEMLAGRLPFVSEDDDPVSIALQHISGVPPRLRSLVPELASDVESVVMRAMARDPATRPSALELAGILARAAQVEWVESSDRSGEVRTLDPARARSIEEPAWVKTRIVEHPLAASDEDPKC